MVHTHVFSKIPGEEHRDSFTPEKLQTQFPSLIMAFSISHFNQKSLTQFEFHWNRFLLTCHLGMYPQVFKTLKN